MSKALRVDERLIHGQVAMAWTRDLKIQGLNPVPAEAPASTPECSTTPQVLDPRRHGALRGQQIDI